MGDRTQSLPTQALARVAAACGLFCLVSSGVYLINDIRDRNADRLHPVKRQRPIAAGTMSVPFAAVMAAGFVLVGLGGAFRLERNFGETVAVYVLLQLVYTLWLKQVALVDVFVIAIGFVLRATGGGLAAGVAISPWLLLCAFLLALFLALCKRRHEKLLLDNGGAEHRTSLEDYATKTLDQLIAIVAAATIVSYSIYTLWPETTHKFGTARLSLTIPLATFGIFRYLDLVYRKDDGGRPERLLLTDGPLLLSIVLYGLTVLAVFCFSRQGLFW
jgi:4-hydroxybenzoate polyprenyltransferase